MLAGRFWSSTEQLTRYPVSTRIFENIRSNFGFSPRWGKYDAPIRLNLILKSMLWSQSQQNLTMIGRGGHRARKIRSHLRFFASPARAKVLYRQPEIWRERAHHSFTRARQICLDQRREWVWKSQNSKLYILDNSYYFLKPNRITCPNPAILTFVKCAASTLTLVLKPPVLSLPPSFTANLTTIILYPTTAKFQISRLDVLLLKLLNRLTSHLFHILDWLSSGFTPWVKKGCHPSHGYNFVNSWPICKTLSLLQRAVNFQQNPH